MSAKIFLTVSRAPITTREALTFMLHTCQISVLSSLRFSTFSFSLVGTFYFPGIVMSISRVSLFWGSTKAKSGLLVAIEWTVVTGLSQKILVASFSTYPIILWSKQAGTSSGTLWFLHKHHWTYLTSWSVPLSIGSGGWLLTTRNEVGDGLMITAWHTAIVIRSTSSDDFAIDTGLEDLVLSSHQKAFGLRHECTGPQPFVTEVLFTYAWSITFQNLPWSAFCLTWSNSWSCCTGWGERSSVPLRPGQTAGLAAQHLSISTASVSDEGLADGRSQSESSFP